VIDENVAKQKKGIDEMIGELFVNIAQIVTGFAMVASVIFLGVQIRQNQIMMKLDFGYKLNERLYRRYFESSHNQEFAKLLSRNWREEEFEDHDYWRMTLWIQTCLVDIFDSYDQFKSGVIDESHLNIRMHLIKSGIMETKMGIPTWNFWKQSRSEEFVNWFENEVFGRELEIEGGVLDEFDELNMVKK
jgi:hypothetical protein|tara:strand:- start:200 stop:766 length:567 start_codon:yes stop_codon:yes gene_type:complete